MDEVVVSGCGIEASRTLPLNIFTTAMRSLCGVWFAAALYHGLSVFTGWHLRVESVSEHAEGSFLQIGGSGNRAIHLQRVPTMLPDSLSGSGSLACDAAGQRFVLSDGLFVFTGGLSMERFVTSSAAGAASKPPIAGLHWDEVQCPLLVGEGLQDAAVVCTSGSSNGARACEALVLHRNGRRLATCSLAGPSASLGEFSANISDSWLDHLRPSAIGVSGGRALPARHHARLEKAVALVHDSRGCTSCSTLDQHHASVLLATTKGRVVQVRQRASHEAFLPEGMLANGEVFGEVGHGKMRSLSAGYLGMLEGDGRRIAVLDTRTNRLAGWLSIPASSAAAGFCVGGGFVYLLESQAGGGLWRFPLPEQLTATYELYAGSASATH